MTAANTPALSFRPATSEDCRLIWEWANEPAMREGSFFSDLIPFAVHKKWYDARVPSENCEIFIVLDSDGKETGVLRFELDGGDAVISVGIEPGHRGKGYSLEIINRGCELFSGHKKVAQFVAEIRQDHVVSQNIFAKAGFIKTGTFVKNGTPGVRMTRSGGKSS